MGHPDGGTGQDHGKGRRVSCPKEAEGLLLSDERGRCGWQAKTEATQGVWAPAGETALQDLEGVVKMGRTK